MPGNLALLLCAHPFRHEICTAEPHACIYYHENAAKYVTYLHGPISQKLMFCNSEEGNFAESEMSQGSKEHLDEGTEASTEGAQGIAR